MTCDKRGRGGSKMAKKSVTSFMDSPIRMKPQESNPRIEANDFLDTYLLCLTHSIYFVEEYVAVYYYIDRAHKKILPGCPAKFGVNLRRIGPIEGYVAIAVPVIACSPLSNPEEVKGKIVFVQRGRCMFIEKARHLQKAGAIAGIVIDDNPTSSVEKTRMFSMDGNDQDDVTIPLVFMFSKEAKILLKRFEENPETVFGVTDDSILEETEEDPSAPPTESAKDPDPPSSKLSDVEFVDSKPSPKSLEPDEFITTTTHQKPPPPSKSTADPSILSAQKQVQLLLLQKLHHLQQIWTELDRILRDPARLEAYQRVSREPAFHAALERLVRSREEGGGSLPDQDVQQFLTRLLGLVGREQKPCFEGRSVSPGYSREAFVAFLGGDRELYDYRFSCAGSQLGIGEKVLEDAVFSTRTVVAGSAEDWGS